MSADESRQDRVLKKAQLWIAVLVGTVTLAIGLYNAKNLFFTRKAGPGGISVAVHSAQGQPVAEARVELLSSDHALVSSAVTDAQGTFEKEGMESGSYTLKVSKTGFDPEIVAVSVQPQKTGHFNLILRSTGSPVRSAIEEVGAGWIRDLGASKRKETAE